MESIGLLTPPGIKDVHQLVDFLAQAGGEEIGSRWLRFGGIGFCMWFERITLLRSAAIDDWRTSVDCRKASKTSSGLRSGERRECRQAG